MSTMKVGDRVKVAQGTPLLLKKGNIHTIGGFTDDGRIILKEFFDVSFLPHRFTLVKPRGKAAQKAKAESLTKETMKKTFKVGDRVQLMHLQNAGTWHNLEVNGVYTVSYVDEWLNDQVIRLQEDTNGGTWDTDRFSLYVKPARHGYSNTPPLEELDTAFQKNDVNYFSASLAAYTELLKATKAWPKPANSAHEAFAVLHEEFDELKAHVWTKQKNRDLTAMRKEAIQVAAMAIRFAAEVCSEERGRR